MPLVERKRASKHAGAWMLLGLLAPLAIASLAIVVVYVHPIKFEAGDRRYHVGPISPCWIARSDREGVPIPEGYSRDGLGSIAASYSFRYGEWGLHLAWFDLKEVRRERAEAARLRH